MFNLPEIDYHDLSTAEGRASYTAAVRQRATAWADNFEPLGGGDGEPYQLGQGNGLWIDLVERWDNEFGDSAVSDINEAERIGSEVCEQVIVELVAKRLPDDE